MKEQKDKQIQFKASQTWIRRVKRAAGRHDTSMSQFIRDSVNARLEKVETAKAA